MDYKKLIKENCGQFNDEDNLIDFISSYCDKDGNDATEQEDNIHEYADGLVPIYYNDIMNEWRDNGECHGEAKAQFGEVDESGDVYKIMQQDLFCMYFNELQTDYQAFLDLVDEQEDE